MTHTIYPDTVVYQDALSKLVRYLDANEDAAVVAPKLLNSDGSLQKSVWRFPTLWSVFTEMLYLHFLSGRKNYNDKDKAMIFEAESFSGAAILFRREILETLKGLDEELFWIEDVDFVYRAREASGRVRLAGFDAHRWLPPPRLAELPQSAVMGKALRLVNRS